MIGGLLPAVILIIILVSMSKKKNEKSAGIKIKYDRKLFRIAVVAAIVGGILLALGIFGLIIDIPLEFGLFAVFGIYMGGGVFVCSLAGVVESIMYFRRLKAYGYEIPEDKKSYDSLLENLPKSEPAVSGPDGISIYQKHSRISAGLCIAVMIFLFVCALLYFKKWYFIKDSAESMLFMLFFADLFWIVPAILFYKQSDTYKYRDDVENDITRKARMSLEGYLFVILFLGFISFMIHKTADSMTDYVFKSKMLAERDRLLEIERAVEGGISVCMESDTYGYPDFEKTYDSLCKGVDITTWEPPYDPLQEKILEELRIEDFTDLRDRFQLTDKDPQIVVHVKGNSITVKINNPLPETDRSAYKMEVTKEMK